MNSGFNYIIVTNTINRSLYLVERSIKASLNQTIKPQKVILIDQNSKSLVLSGDILNNPNFQKTNVQFKSISAARNSFIIPQSIDWILFCDDDGYPHENYSEILSSLIRNNPEIEIFAGNVLREDSKTNFNLRQKWGGSLNKFRNTKMLMGSNIVVKRNVFEELGKFDERLGIGSFWGSGEDTDFCWKAYFSKKKMKFSKELIVFHIPPFQESIKAGFRKSFKYGVGKGALVWKWMFIKHKVIVIYELLEMLIIPIILILRALFTLKFSVIANNIAAIAGRIFGLIKAAFVFR